MPLRIAIVGYGKMGKAIEAEALARGHNISHRISHSNEEQIAGIMPANADVAIEFTQPASALPHINLLLSNGIPVVCGTTGWEADTDLLRKTVAAQDGALLYGSNFSPGMNILFRLNEILAGWMNQFPEYDVFIEEKHHHNKKDAPGGSAKHLAEQVIHSLYRKTSWVSAELQNRPPRSEELSLSWVRAGEITGEHEVNYISSIDRISICHEAFNRRGFALGAVMGAEWLAGRKGFHLFSELFTQNHK